MTVKELRRWLRRQPNSANVKALVVGLASGSHETMLEETWWERGGGTEGQDRDTVLLYVEPRS